MRFDAGWSRRTFVTTLGLAGAAAALPASEPRATTPAAARESVPARPYAVTLAQSSGGGHHGIFPMRVDEDRWASVGPRILLTRMFPMALALHPTLDAMYIAHGEGPSTPGRGSVAGYAFDRATLQLEERSATSLALYSTFPGALAVSPDGRWLLVAGARSGAYNVLPLSEDGRIGSLEHVLKMTGGGRRFRSAHVDNVLFHKAGVAYGSDFASDRVDVISLPSRKDGEAPAVVGRRLFEEGSAPMHMALAPGQDSLFIVGAWQPAITRVPLDPSTGAMTGDGQRHRLQGFGGGPVVVGPGGERVYVTTQERQAKAVGGRHDAGATLVWVLEVSRRGWRTVERVRVPEILWAGQMVVQGEDLLLMGNGGVCAMRLDDGRGRLGERRHVVPKGDFSDAVVHVL